MEKETVNKVCQECNKNKATDEHHKDGNHKNDEESNKRYLCTLCHAKIHNISPKKSELKHLVIFRDRAIKIRNALDNQTRGFGRIEYVVPESWNNESELWNNKIKDYEKQIKKLLKSGSYPIWDKYLKSTKGISFVTASKLIAYIDIFNTPTISALWRYCGLDATHIKRTNGMSQAEAKKFGNPYLKKELMGILADSFIKQRTPIYRKIYDKEKARQLEFHKQGLCERCNKLKLNKKAGHSDMRAKRKSVKIFLSHFWTEWRTLEGLEVSEPYIIGKGMHSHKI